MPGWLITVSKKKSRKSLGHSNSFIEEGNTITLLLSWQQCMLKTLHIWWQEMAFSISDDNHRILGEKLLSSTKNNFSKISTLTRYVQLFEILKIESIFSVINWLCRVPSSKITHIYNNKLIKLASILVKKIAKRSFSLGRKYIDPK